MPGAVVRSGTNLQLSVGNVLGAVDSSVSANLRSLLGSELLTERKCGVFDVCNLQRISTYPRCCPLSGRMFSEFSTPTIIAVGGGMA